MHGPSFAPLVLAALGMAALTVGCATGLDETPAPVVPLAAPAPVNGGEVGAEAPPRRTPSLVVDEINGADPAQVRAVFAPVEKKMSDCQPATKGVITVRVLTTPSGVRLAVEKGLDPSLQRCALMVLSTADIEAIAGEPRAPLGLRTFTAHLRIEW
jgi:hypothetical protein